MDSKPSIQRGRLLLVHRSVVATTSSQCFSALTQARGTGVLHHASRWHLALVSLPLKPLLGASGSGHVHTVNNTSEHARNYMR